MPYLRKAKDGRVALHIHAQPKASTSRIVGLYGGRLKIAVAAPPVDGKANAALEKYLAKLLGVPGRNVSVSSGAQSRQKVVMVKSQDAVTVRSIIESNL